MRLYQRFHQWLRDHKRQRALIQKATLTTQKPSNNKPITEVKFECRICGDSISEDEFEENDELCEDCYFYESNTEEEEEFDSL